MKVQNKQAKTGSQALCGAVDSKRIVGGTAKVFRLPTLTTFPWLMVWQRHGRPEPAKGSDKGRSGTSIRRIALTGIRRTALQLKTSLSLLPITLMITFGWVEVKAEDYYWSYPYVLNHFSSYSEACEAYRQYRHLNSSVPPISTSWVPRNNEPGNCMGVFSRDTIGAPTVYYCGVDKKIFLKPDSTYDVLYGGCGDVSRNGDSCNLPKTLNAKTGSCELPTESPKNSPGKKCDSTPNPVNIISGNKHLDIVDVSNNETSPLTFIRFYSSHKEYKNERNFNSASLFNAGINWSHNFFKGITAYSDEIKLTIPNGQTFIFKPVSGLWQPDTDVNYRLTEIKDVGGIRTGWKLVTPTGEVEAYSAIGDLLSILDTNGLSQTLTYSCTTVGATCPVATPTTVAPYAGLLIKVTDNFGRSLNFTYNTSGQMATMTDPAGNVYSYGYDGSGNLKTVTYPDDTPSVTTDNPKTTYIYGADTGETANICSPGNTPACTPNAGVDYSHSLTGVIDENGVRTMTYQYDSNGKTFNEFHNGNIDKYNLAYGYDSNNNPYTSVTDPLGSVRTTHFTTILGVVKPTGTDQPGGSGCAAASSAMTYDANGNVASKTDFNGHKSCFSYDLSRNLETARVEGLASVADCAANLSASTLALPLRKATSQWHPDWRLATRTAEPKLITTNVYNGQPDPTNGNSVLTCAPASALVDGKPLAVLCKKVEQATTDTTGVLGFAAVAAGTPRISTYTYNNYGQVLTEDGPRTDVVDKITTTYYPDNDPVVDNRGNIKTVTNALGQVTTYNSYDNNGRPLQITAPNGVVTTLSYYPRGWLKTLGTRDAASTLVETTSYTYDPTGLLLTVTQPDTSKLTYGYDAAHRLTSVTDNLGNKVIYTLDAMGNRKNEAYNDSAGVLKRNIDRVYDALNRLKYVTGAAQ